MIMTKQQDERLILVTVCTGSSEFAEHSLDELEELVDTAGGITIGRLVQNRESIHPGTYLGSGKLDELIETDREFYRPQCLEAKDNRKINLLRQLQKCQGRRAQCAESAKRHAGNTVSLLLSALVITMILWAPRARAAHYEQLGGYPFVLVGNPGTLSDPDVTDSLFNAASRGIRF